MCWHAQRFGGESPLSNLMEVKGPSENARLTLLRGVGKKRGVKSASRWTTTGYKALAPDEQATYCEVRIHQRCEA